MIAALIILVGIAVSYSLWQVLTEEPTAKVMPLSPDDEALQHHYRALAAWEVAQRKATRDRDRRVWELRYREAQAFRLWIGRGIAPRKVG